MKKKYILIIMFSLFLISYMAIIINMATAKKDNTLVVDSLGNLSIEATQRLKNYSNSYDNEIQGYRENIRDLINRIAQNVSKSHTYVLHKFDCTQFSKDLVNQLSLNNITAYCVAGYMWEYDKDHKKIGKALHTWVEVKNDEEIIPVEATNGFIISEDDYQSNYKIIRRNLCW